MRRLDMETLSTLLALCEGKRPVIQSFDILLVEQADEQTTEEPVI